MCPFPTLTRFPLNFPPCHPFSLSLSLSISPYGTLTARSLLVNHRFQRCWSWFLGPRTPQSRLRISSRFLNCFVFRCSHLLHLSLRKSCFIIAEWNSSSWIPAENQSVHLDFAISFFVCLRASNAVFWCALLPFVCVPVHCSNFHFSPLCSSFLLLCISVSEFACLR